MNNRDLTKLALKVFSIYVMVQAMLAMPQFFQIYILFSNDTEYNSENWFILISIISIFLLILLSIFIWKLSKSISTTTSSESTTSSSNISEEFVLSALGIYITVTGLIRVSTTSISIYHLLQSSSDSGINTSHNIMYLVVYLVVAALGLTLVIKTKGWVRILNKLRVAGT